MNKVCLYGRIATDIEFEKSKKYTYAKFNLAVADGKDDEGNSLAQFIPITAWNKMAENINEYLGKGDRVALVGKIKIDSYEDKDGIRRKSFNVIVEQVDFVESLKQDDEDDDFDEKYEKKKSKVEKSYKRKR